MSLQSFDMEELGFFVSLCLASCGGLMAIIFRSRCKTVKTPCLQCEREVYHDKNEVLKKTKSTATDRGAEDTAIAEGEPEPENNTLSPKSNP